MLDQLLAPVSSYDFNLAELNPDQSISTAMDSLQLPALFGRLPKILAAR